MRRIFLYLLVCRDEGGPFYVKMGRAMSPVERLGQLMTGCPIPGVQMLFAAMDSDELAIQVEKRLHRYFSARKVRGEWFKFFFSEESEVEELNYGIGQSFWMHGFEAPRWITLDLNDWQRKADAARMAYVKNIEAQRDKISRRSVLQAEEARARKRARIVKFLG